MDGTILSQGLFQVPATGVINQYIAVPSGTDWVWTYNFTQSTVVGGATPNSVENYWQIGMPVGSSYVKYYATAGAALNADYIATGGISVYDPSGVNPYALPLVGAPVATTAISNATRPIVLTANTGNVVVGSVVRMSNTAQTDTSGVDFVVGAVTPNVSFTLLAASNALANVPGGIGGAGFYRQINVESPWYPARRYITNIVAANANSVISLSTAAGFVVGQLVRFSIPAVSGMVQLDGQTATILSKIDEYNYLVNVNVTGFTAFTFPTIAQQASSYPLLVPVGEDTARALSIAGVQFPIINGLVIPGTQSGILSDSTVNTAFLGIVLGTGATGLISGDATTGPAGTAANDFVFWRAGKSSYGGQ